MEVRFNVEPGARLTRDMLDGVKGDVEKLIQERFLIDLGTASWLEAGGYVKWASGKADLEPQIQREEVVRLESLSDLARITER